MAIRVLIADDQAMVRAGFRMILDIEPDMEVVGEAADGEQAVVVARRTRPDLAVMDIRMPVLDGVAATRRLLAEVDPPPHVLMVTTFSDDESLYSALRAGAGGFLLKNAPPEQLVDAVRSVAAGEGLLSPAVTRRVIEELARTSPPPQSTSPEALAELTERELEVLRLMARGLSNAEIADALVITVGTAKTHVGRILTKLDLRDRVQAVVLAYETGLVRPGGPSR
jgi:DNA-binding NarL/FixJ family response regulator